MENKRGLDKNKKAQTKISFGMIFSIFLIIAILSFGFYAIKFLLDLQKTAKIGTFVNALEEDVNSLWKATQASKKESYNLPNKIKYVCFFEQETSTKGRYKNLYNEFEIISQPKDNMYFYPLNTAGELNVLEIEHLDIVNMTLNNNPYCVENKDGTIEILLKKDFGGNLVVIENP